MHYLVDLLLSEGGRWQVEFKANAPLYFYQIEERAQQAFAEKYATPASFTVEKVMCSTDDEFHVPAHGWRNGSFMLGQLNVMKRMVPNVAHNSMVYPDSAMAETRMPFGAPIEIGYKVSKWQWMWIEKDCPQANGLNAVVQGDDGQFHWAERKDGKWFIPESWDEIKATRYALICHVRVEMKAVWITPNLL